MSERSWERAPICGTPSAKPVELYKQLGGKEGQAASGWGVRCGPTWVFFILRRKGNRTGTLGLAWNRPVPLDWVRKDIRARHHVSQHPGSLLGPAWVTWGTEIRREDQGDMEDGNSSIFSSVLTSHSNQYSVFQIHIDYAHQVWN